MFIIRKKTTKVSVVLWGHWSESSSTIMN